jgi:23S rRNA (uracil1939-C5)-methyltransferase
VRRPRPKAAAPRAAEIVITALGAQGDGIADTPHGRLYVPFALPGEALRVRIGAKRGDGFAAEIAERLTTSAQRMEPPCPHFGICGGCAVQHMADDAYAAWKRGLIIDALAKRGLNDIPVEPLIAVPPGRRRRAALAVARLADRAIVGFNAPFSHRVVAVERCLHLLPRLSGLIAPLRDLLMDIAAPDSFGDAIIGETEGALDVVLAVPIADNLETRERLAGFAQAHDLARLSRQVETGEPEIISNRRPVRLHVGEVAVDVPPGAFAQPSSEGEALLAREILAATDTAGRIADLFAGCGVFALHMAAREARVIALEGAAEPARALAAAAARAGWSDRLTVERRDLARRPLQGDELKKLDAAVFDPPRAGARTQAEALAASSVPIVVAVSCAPSTFARDARILIDGGYRLERLTPVDQFPYTAHLEVVGVFRKKR